MLGYGTATGSANNSQGRIRIYGTNTGYTTIVPGYNSTSNVTITLPASSGTLALTDHTHSTYLPLTGGTINGDVTFNDGNITVKSNSNFNCGTMYENASTDNYAYITFTSGTVILGTRQAHEVRLVNSADNPSWRPTFDDELNLGAGNYRWKTVYAKNGTIQTSDRNSKKNFANFDERHEKFFMLLLPKTYQFIDGTSGRTHFGFVAQDVENALKECGLTSLDFAGLCKDIKTIPVYKEVYDSKTGRMKKEYAGEENVLDENGNPVYIYSLRYDEFTSLVVWMLQKLYKEKSLMYNEIKSIKSRLLLIEK